MLLADSEIKVTALEQVAQLEDNVSQVVDQSDISRTHLQSRFFV